MRGSDRTESAVGERERHGTDSGEGSFWFWAQWKPFWGNQRVLCPWAEGLERRVEIGV